MSWTDDRVDTLKKLWGEGKTAAEIAKELGGVTRNAVIGKAHRLKLSNRVSPIQQNNKKPTAVSSVSTATTVKAAPKKAAANKSAPTLPPAALEVVPDNREKYSLLELSARQCRWPYGDPREDNFGFCGCESMSGFPYCGEHAQLAYQAATRNKILKAESAKKEETQDQQAVG